MYEKQKNIVLIQTDQMHASGLGLGRNPNVRTPNLDRLAGQGAVFEQAVCNNPICMPSRVSTLSSQYCSSSGQFGFNGRCGSHTPWLHAHLKENGYVTGAVGKFHCDCMNRDEWCFSYSAPTLSEDRDMAIPSGNTYEAYCLKHGLTVPNDQMHGHVPYQKDYWENRLPGSAEGEENHYAQRACRSDVPLEHSLETWTTDQAIHFLRERPGQDQPFFLWFSFDRPHWPTTLPEPWYSRIRPDELELPPLPSAEDIRSWPTELIEATLYGGSISAMGEEKFRLMLATYFTLIEWIDDEIGRFMNELEQLGLDQDTTIIFTSDHGDDAGDHGRSDKYMIHTFSEGITRVPLLIRPAPALNLPVTGSIFPEPVELVDLFPSLCGLHGLPPHKDTEGRDLSPALRGEKPLDPDRPVFCEEYTRRMILWNGWRLVFDATDQDACMLTDLNRDPHAFVNVYADPSASGHRLRLKQKLLTFLCERRWGGFSQTDIARVKDGLNPDHAMLPVRVPAKAGLRNFNRAAVTAATDSAAALIPLYDEPPLLFALGGIGYVDQSDVLEFCPQTAEAVVDDCLRAMMLLNQPVSDNAPIALPPWPEHTRNPKPSLDTIRKTLETV